MDQDLDRRRDGGADFDAEGVGVGRDVVLSALASIRDAVADLTAAQLWSRSDAASRDGVREGFAVLQSLESAWLGLVADLDSRAEAVPGAKAGKVAQTFLRGRLFRTAGQAAADVRAAHALAAEADPGAGGMPSLGAAFAAGRVSREHVEVALKAVRKLPARVLSEPLPPVEGFGPQTPDGQDPGEREAVDRPEDEREGADRVESEPEAVDRVEGEPAESEVLAGAAVDAFFAAQSQAMTSRQCGFLARHLLEALDPDGQDGFDPDAFERRGLTHSSDANGMVVGRFQLDPVSGAWFVTAIEHFSAPDPSVQEPSEDGGTVPARDTRSGAQRRADALGLISRLALGSEQAGTATGGGPPRFVIHTGVQDLLQALNDSPPDSHPKPQPPEPNNCEPTAPESMTPFPADVAPGPSRTRPTETTTSTETSAHPSTHGATTDHPRADDDLRAQDWAAQEIEEIEETEEALPQAPDNGGHPFRAAGPAFTRRGSHCEALGPIGPRLLGRLACDALLQKVLLSSSGAVLDLGRDTRTVSRAQRRALNARDRGCVIPGCSAPPAWCEGHHVLWWRSNGRTDIDNLALVCGRDHTLIHLGIWELTMINGVAWARPPTWIDPLRRLTRNTLHQSADQARTLGTQLHLALPHNSNQSPTQRVHPNQDHRGPPSPDTG